MRLRLASAAVCVLAVVVAVVVGRVPAYAADMLTDGGFEAGISQTAGTGTSTQPTRTWVTSPVHAGGHALKLAYGAAGAGSHTGFCFNPGAVSPPFAANTTYTLAGWVQSPRPQVLRLSGIGNGPTSTAGSGGWERLEWTFTTGATPPTKPCLVTEAATVSGDVAVADDFTLAQGGPGPSPTPTPTVSPTPPACTPPTGTLAVAVCGTGLVDSSGATLHVHGVSRASTEYACVRGSGAAFSDGNETASSPYPAAMVGWHANTVRVPLNEDCWLGINGAPFAGAAYQAALRTWVDKLLGTGLRVVLDLHWSAPGGLLATGQQPMADADHSPTFWAQVATAYRGDPGVVFELYNEPHDVPWACWKAGGCTVTSREGTPYTVAGMDQLIAAIRGAGAGNVVIATGLAWGNDLTGWASNRPADPAGQLAAGTHVYQSNQSNTPTEWATDYTAVLGDVPLLMTEGGPGPSGGTCDPAIFTGPSGYFGWSDGNGGDGYIPWAWNAQSCAGFPALVTDATIGAPSQTYGQGVHDWFVSRF